MKSDGLVQMYGSSGNRRKSRNPHSLKQSLKEYQFSILRPPLLGRFRFKILQYQPCSHIHNKLQRLMQF